MAVRYPDLEILGVEALPNGLAEIMRTLQSNLERPAKRRQPLKRRGLIGIFTWRKAQQSSA